MRRGLNILLVVVISIVAVFITQPDYLLPIQPYGWVGLDVDPNGDITAVASNSDAARAGIAPGDTIDLSRLSLQDRRFVGAFSPVGSKFTYPIEHRGVTRDVTLTSVVRTRSLADNVANDFETFAALIAILVSAMLVLLRPSAMTWGFLFFAFSSLPASEWNYESLPLGWWIASQLWILTIGALGGAGLLVFAARFPTDAPTGWRAWVAKGAWLLVPALLAFGLYTAYLWNFGQGAKLYAQINIEIGYAIGVMALLLILDALRHSTGVARQRMRWVIAAIVVVIASGLASWFLIGFGTVAPAYLWLADVGQTVQVIIPITVAYVLIKHRVVDVTFVLSRAAVYGIVTAVIVVCFAVLDWLFGRVLSATQWAVPAELLGAIGIGFGLNNFEKRVDRVVDGVLFRQRHLAELRLARVAQTLPHVPEFSVADEFLVREPVDALGLTSGAVFRRQDDGRFVRVCSNGWSDDHLRSLGPTDSLVLQLVATESPLRMREVLWPHPDLPQKEAAPTIALPIIVRHQLRGVALYGVHRSGADIDEDEVRALTAVTRAAAAAYDHIEAETLRNRVRDLTEALARVSAAPA